MKTEKPYLSEAKQINMANLDLLKTNPGVLQ